MRAVAPLRATLSEGRSHGDRSVVVVGDGSGGGVAIRTSGVDRVEEIRAEIKALARASEASVYSADRLDRKYTSRPLKVLSLQLYACVFLRVSKS